MQTIIPIERMVRLLLCLLLAPSMYQTVSGQTFTVTPAKAYNYVNGVGVNTHLRFTNVYRNAFDSIILPRLKESGIKHIRDAVPYKSFVSVTDSLLIGDRFIKLYDEGGIKTCYLLDNKKVVDSLHFRDSADYLSVFQSIPGLSATVDCLEGFNEPDLTIYTWYPANWDTLTYAIQRGLWTRAKSMPELSGAPVLCTSFVTYYGPRPDRVLAMSPAISTYFDYGNYHMYDAGSSNRSFFPGFYYDYYTKYTDIDSMRHGKPWMITETGYENAINWNRPSSPGYIANTYHYLSELAAGKYYSVMFMEMFRRGAQRVYGYEFIDENTADQSNSENNFGLIHTDGTVKPAYTAIKNTIGILNDNTTAFTPTPLTYTLSGNTAGINNSLYQKSNGNYYLALWQGKDSGVCYDFINFADLPSDSQQVKIVLPFTSSQIKIYQPLISNSAIYTYCNKDTITVNVPDHLLLVEISPVSGEIPTKENPGKTSVKMTVFSPPNQNSVHITLYSKEQQKGVIEIYSSSGALVAEQAATASENRNNYDIACPLSPGIYFAVFRSAKGVVSERFLK